MAEIVKFKGKASTDVSKPDSSPEWEAVAKSPFETDDEQGLIGELEERRRQARAVELKFDSDNPSRRKRRW